jgi:hypothetical protein
MVLTACFGDVTRPHSTRLRHCLCELLIADPRLPSGGCNVTLIPRLRVRGVVHSVTAITVAHFAHHNIGILPR